MKIFRDENKARSIGTFVRGLQALNPPESVESQFYRMMDSSCEELSLLLTKKGRAEAERVSDSIDFYEWLVNASLTPGSV